MTGEKIRTLRKDHNKPNKNDDIMDTYDESSHGGTTVNIPDSNPLKTNKAFQQQQQQQQSVPSQQQLSNINANNLNAHTSIGHALVDDNKNPIILEGLELPVHECVFRADVRRLSSLIRVHSISQKDVHGELSVCVWRMNMQSDVMLALGLNCVLLFSLFRKYTSSPGCDVGSQR